MSLFLHPRLRPFRAILLSLLATSVLAGWLSRPAAAEAAAAPAPPLPRAYVVTTAAETTDVEFSNPLLALSADGRTAVHPAPRGEERPVLAATDPQSGAQEVVGVGLQGAELPAVSAAAVSGDGRRVAMVAHGRSVEDLQLPAGTDPDLREAIFVRDRLTGSTTWVPVPDLGVPASHHRLRGIALSDDGTRLATRITLPLPRYGGVTEPSGVLIATLAENSPPATHVVLPEHLLEPGSDPAVAEPKVHTAALSGDGNVLAVAAERDFESALLRFDATTGARLAGARPLTTTARAAWEPNLDRTGRRTALGGVGPGVVVADLVDGPAADLTLSAGTTAPFVSGDASFGSEAPAAARLSAAGNVVTFLRAGALWAQPVGTGTTPRLASPGLDGRIADPVAGEVSTYPDRVASHAGSADGSVLTFLSASTAFVDPRTDEPQPSHLYRSVPADAPAPTWPEGAALALTPGTTSVSVSWPAAAGAVTGYAVSVDGREAATVAPPATSTLVQGLTPGSTVAVSVVARDADGRTSSPLAATVTLAEDLPPGDAPLSAVAGPGARVQLGWEPSTLAGLTGYRVLRDGAALVDLPVGATGHLDTTVAADTTYTYAVAALRGTDEVRLTRDATVRTPVLTLTDAAWHLPRVLPTPFLAPSRPASFAMVGAPGFTATATVRLRTDAGEAPPVTVPLPETEPGTYRGTWPIPTGIVEVVAATLRLSDGAGTSRDRDVAGLPAPVGGLLRLAVDAPAGEASGVRLQVWSPSRSAGALRTLAGDGAVDVPVAPAADHELAMTRPDGRDAVARRTLELAPGQAVDLALAPSLPASINVVARQHTSPLALTRVTLTAPSGPQAATTDKQGLAAFDGLDAGDEVTVTAEPSSELLAAKGLGLPAPRTMTLAQGPNQVELSASPLPRIPLTGTIRDATGQPVQAKVTVRQELHGVGLGSTADSAADGTWTVEVLGDTGAPTRVSATAIGATTGAEVSVGATPPPPLDLVLPWTQGFVVRPKLWIKPLDGAPVAQELDPRNMIHLRGKVIAGDREHRPSAQVPVNAAPGSSVRFCADGIETGLPNGCATATLGASQNIPLELTLTEVARLTARVVQSDGQPYPGLYSVRLTGPKPTFGRSFSDPNLSFSVPQAGSYVLHIGSAAGSVERVVEVVDGRITPLGDLRLSSTSILDGRRSGLSAVTDAVTPGELAELRAVITYRDATDSGTARLALPAGTSIPADGVLVDGAVAEHSVEAGPGGGTLVVPLAAAAERSLRVFVRVPDQAGTRLAFSMSVSGRRGTDVLGTATVLSGYVSITAPSQTSGGPVTVSGRAPAGSEVVVRSGEQQLATATAGPGGLWHAVVELEGAGDDVRHHLLTAQALVGGSLLVSKVAAVTVDPHAGVLESVTMRQMDGRSVSFRAADGVARFPFTWVPGQPVTVVARFTGPAEGVKARLGDVVRDMTPMAGEENTYQASVLAASTEVGDLTIVYVPVRQRPLLPVPPKPDPGDVLVDPATVVLQEPVTEGGTVRQTFTAAAPALGPNATATGTFSVEKLTGYEATEEDAKRAAGAGVRAYEAGLGAEDPHLITMIGSWSYEMTAVVDLDSLFDAEPTALSARLASLNVVGGAARIGYRMAFNGATQGESLLSAIKGGEKYDKINKLRELAAECDYAISREYFVAMTEGLMDQSFRLDAYTAVSGVAGLVLAPATFGIGTVVLWGSTWAVGKIVEFEIDRKIEQLHNEIATDPLCEEDEEEEDPSEDPNDPDSPDDPDDDSNEPDSPDVDAEPDWIFDPSGVAYEGTASRKVEGVTATLLRARTAGGPWNVWAAEAYGQVNPQSTDAQGHYGWDVPEGWWKVVYAKPGYLSAESRVLRVLPPHTDVDVNMVRADATTVERVTADDTGLTVTFSQPVRTSVAQAAGMLTVTTPSGDAVGGTWAAERPEPAPAGHPYAGEPLATGYRFTGERFAGEVKVGIDGLVQDHGGRVLAEGRSESLTVAWSGPDAVPPTVTVTGVAEGGTYRLGAVPAAGCATEDAGSGVATPATLTLTGGAPGGVGRFTATCAGAVDKAGNEAPPVSVGFSVAYVFSGFASPVDNGVVNVAKAGQAIPLKWRLTTATGAPVTDLGTAGLLVSGLSCSSSAASDAVEEYAPGASALQNLGDGYYQLNWKTPKAYAGTCQSLRLDLGEGPDVAHVATFRFKS